MKQKLKKYLIIIFLISLISISSIGIFFGNLLYNLVIDSNDSKNAIYAEYICNDNFTQNTWLLKQSNYEDKYITSFDNLNLHAYSITNEVDTSNLVIAVHVYGEEGKLMSLEALHFYQMGYNILIPDLRGYGQSEGDYTGMGYHDRLDICSWIDNLIEEDPNCQIALYGISMGASTVLMSSGQDLPSNVKAVISDCAYTSVNEIFDYAFDTYFNIPPFPIVNFTNLITMFRAGYSLDDTSVIKYLEKSKTPTLFIHGDSDKLIPYEMMNELYNTVSCDKEKLLIEDGEHATSSLADFQTYWTYVSNFLEKYFT